VEIGALSGSILRNAGALGSATAYSAQPVLAVTTSPSRTSGCCDSTTTPTLNARIVAPVSTLA
jgi:hypothetical protein